MVELVDVFTQLGVGAFGMYLMYSIVKNEFNRVENKLTKIDLDLEFLKAKKIKDEK